MPKNRDPLMGRKIVTLLLFPVLILLWLASWTLLFAVSAEKPRTRARLSMEVAYNNLLYFISMSDKPKNISHRLGKA